MGAWIVVGVLVGFLVGLMGGALVTVRDRGRLRAAFDAREERRASIEATVRAGRLGHGDVFVLVRPAWQTVLRTSAGTLVLQSTADKPVPPEDLGRRLLALVGRGGNGGDTEGDGPPSSRGQALVEQLAAVRQADAAAAPRLQRLRGGDHGLGYRGRAAHGHA